VNPEELLRQVADQVRSCTKCRLNMGRKHAVPGEGPVDSDIIFIGEGPGFHENEQGRPFVGAAGKFLTELLASIGKTREEVFICNVIKCRPPGNRDPQIDEIQSCEGYLERQIQAISPKVIHSISPRFERS
jgi:DNA polymerase